MLHIGPVNALFRLKSQTYILIFKNLRRFRLVVSSICFASKQKGKFGRMKPHQSYSTHVVIIPDVGRYEGNIL